MEEFINHDVAVRERAMMDTGAFEREDGNDLAAALRTFDGSRNGCVLHMMETMRPSKHDGIEWRLRDYGPWVRKYPNEAIVLRKWLELMESKEELSDLSESVLNLREKLNIADGWQRPDYVDDNPWSKHEHKGGVRDILDKMRLDPKHCDVRVLLNSHWMRADTQYTRDLRSAYTRDVHTQLVALIEPLKTLSRYKGTDAQEKRKLRAPVFATGKEIHRLGEQHFMFNGLFTMQAVFYAIQNLLYDCYSAPSALRFAWDECEDWSA